MSNKHDDVLIKDDKPEALLPEPSHSSTGHLSSILPFIFGLISLAALILAIYAAYQNHQLQALTQNQQTTLQDTQARFEQQLQNQNNLITANKGQQQQLQSQLTTLSTNLEKALHQQLYQKQDWLLYKAKYYLDLAQINAHWSDNQQTTIALLQEADQLLQTTADQQIFTIRQTIAEEINQLKALPKVDTAGILSQLDAARQTVASLPFNEYEGNVLQNKTISEQPNDSSWKSHLKTSLNYLSKLVVVRRNNENIQPLLSPLYQSAVRDSIRISLQAAQWAVLQNNQAVYQQSLAQALADINRYFNLKTQSTLALINQIKTLQKLTIQTEAPSITESSNQLNQYLEQKNNTPAAPAKHEGNPGANLQ